MLFKQVPSHSKWGKSHNFWTKCIDSFHYSKFKHPLNSLILNDFTPMFKFYTPDRFINCSYKITE